MFNANKPRLSDLPTTGQLLRSTGIAAVVASALLITVVLPAEYGVDPIRIGSVFGLTEMGRIKRQLAEEAAADAAVDAAAVDATPVSANPVTTAVSATTVAATTPASAPATAPGAPTKRF